MSRPAKTGREAEDFGGNGVIWHDVECGAYGADLPLWEELTDQSGDRVLELGAGTGRVALHLARRGRRVVALERDAELLAELRRRAEDERLEIETIEADARSFSVAEPVAIVLAPMQLVQLLDRAGRSALLVAVAASLAPGGRAAIALLSEDGLPEAGEERPPLLPDVREVDDWVYSSLPVALRRDNGEIEIRRLRQAVSPAGELSEKLDVTRLEAIDAGGLEAEARSHGLEPGGRREIPATDDHSGSIAVLLRRAR